MNSRFELTDEEWNQIKDFLPPERGRRGRPSKCNRLMLNAMLWIIRTGAPWRDLPEHYGSWKSVHTRFSRWSKQGVWAKVLENIASHPDDEFHMIDSTAVRAHQHAAGAKGGSNFKHSVDQGADSQQKST